MNPRFMEGRHGELTPEQEADIKNYYTRIRQLHDEFFFEEKIEIIRTHRQFRADRQRTFENVKKGITE